MDNSRALFSREVTYELVERPNSFRGGREKVYVVDHRTNHLRMSSVR